MDEKLPQDNLEGFSEQENLENCKDALQEIKSRYGLELNNFEYIKLHQISKKVLHEQHERMEESKTLLKSNPKKFSEEWAALAYSDTGAVPEIVTRFMMECYDIPNSYLPHENKKGIPSIERIRIADDVKQHLRNLQKQRYMDQQ